MDLILAAGDVVYAVGQEGIIGTDLDAADSEVGLAIGHTVAVKHYLFAGLHGAFFTAIQRVVFAFHIAAIIPVTIVDIWHRNIILLLAADQFFVEIFLQLKSGLHYGCGVGILRIQVVDNLGVGAFVQPVIGIAAGMAVDGQFFFYLFRQRRLRQVLTPGHSRNH